MKKHFRKIFFMLTALAVAAVMIPGAAFAGTGKTDDNDYHYTAFGDSITAGVGPAYAADTEFISSGKDIYSRTDIQDASIKDSYVHLLSEKLNNRICGTDEKTVNFTRGSDCVWTKTDAANIFSFTNMALAGENTASFLEILNFSTDSDRTPGTAAYYEDLYKINFCDSSGKAVSITPMVFAMAFKSLADENGEPDKAAIGKFFAEEKEDVIEQLEKADITTLALGSNDLLIKYLYENLYDILEKEDPKLVKLMVSALRNGEEDLSSIDLSAVSDETIIALLQKTKTSVIKSVLNGYVDEGLENYEEILKEIESVGNSHNDVALCSLFNPYGSYSDRYSTPVLIGDIMDALAELTESSEYISAGQKKEASSGSEIELVAAITDWLDDRIYSDTGTKMEKIDSIYDFIEAISGKSSEYSTLAVKLLRNINRYSDALTAVKNADASQQKLINKVLTDKLKMPVLASVVGGPADDAIEKYNEGIKALCDRHDMTYIDISALPADDNPDPHPDLDGHKWIAEKAFDSLKGVVSPALTASGIKSLKASAGKGCLSVSYVPVSRENVTGYNIQYRAYGSSAFKKVKNTSKTTKKITGLKKRKKYVVRVRAYKKSAGETVYGSWKKVSSKNIK